MYLCTQCGCEFKNPVKLTEKHNLDNPPYENIYVCPICKSTNFEKEKVYHCRCCGAKLSGDNKDYCSPACKKKGEQLWLKEIKRKKLLADSSVYSLVREVENYNKNNGTKYSYGQYVALIKTKKKGKKNVKTKKTVS